MPDKLYIKATDSSIAELDKIEQKTYPNIPLIYAQGNTPAITSFHIPQSSSLEVSLLYFSDNGAKAHTSLAFAEGSKLFFPNEMPDLPALVIAKEQGTTYPVGFYFPEEKEMRSFEEFSAFENIVSYKAIETPSSIQNKEQYYVLENEYLQVVFSNLGGSIAEINLPFKTKENPQSSVLPIGPDRRILENYPRNAYFPSRSYYTPGNSKKISPEIGGYYPLLRRDREATKYTHPFTVPSEYYALNLVADDDSETDRLPYTIKRFDKNSIVFELVQDRRKITKTFSLAAIPGGYIPYLLDLEVRVDGDARGLDISSGVPEVELISGSASPELKYRYLKNNKFSIEKIKLPKSNTFIRGVYPEWVSNSNGFFTLLLNPVSDSVSGIESSYINGELDPTRLTVIDAKHDLYPAEKYPGYQYSLPLRPSSKPSHYRFYAGPLDHNVLTTVDKLVEGKTKSNPKFSEAISFHGFFSAISEPFAKFLFFLINIFHNLTNSWGFSIVLLTVVLRVVLYPLNAWSMKSATKMQLIQPEANALKQKYAKDSQKANLEVMKLYREKKVNPFLGCLPQLIQFPFLIGMFDLLKSAFPLRGTVFIPGWINNLTAPDVLFSWSYPIFFFGTEFHLLPIILGGLTFLQSKLTTWLSPNKAVDPSAQKQTMMSGNVLTIVFTLLFYNFPSGLNIYWISSTALAILQQWLISSRLAKETLPKKA